MKLYLKFLFFSTTNCLNWEGLLTKTYNFPVTYGTHGENVIQSRWDIRISFLTQFLKWILNEIQIEHSISLLMLEVLFFMNFINVEVSFIYAGL